ncbi:hypothetical protein CLV91_2782 [Maribacter vaceletii]|uniref:Uncharacterized protein n=1 Tax=Maribacter vaceletii TaxID=1206816 RepID=A0A495DTR1_9FLAO|nr:hypothetical protein [Maribacter vaceletii]RKR08016.1 hypothetical protein CLV91_2782 [Maribacter vaceletii]
MKQFLFLIVTLTILIKPLWPLVEYCVNYDYIKNELCENKAKPMLNCDGKCYLAKQLAKESKGEEDNPFKKNTSNTEIKQVVFIEDLLKIKLEHLFGSEKEKKIVSNRTLVSTLFTKDISHPPELS